MKKTTFALMSLWFAVRDRITPPAEVLAEARLRPGDRVLDFGCGPGGFTLAAAEAVGPEGTVYAVDRNPLALRRIERLVARKGLENLVTLETDCATGLVKGSVDRVLLYDTYHALEQPDEVLDELHRVLAPEGFLSFSDHHMQKPDILAGMTEDGRFRLEEKGRRTYRFARAT